jgi:hypothetical protein
MRADYKNTKVGDQIVFKKAGDWHYFLNRIENAKKLEAGKTYTVKEISVASSSTGVKLEETGELEYELCWFDIIENMNTEIETLTNEIEQSLPKFEETKLEDFGVTTDVKEWLSCIKSEKINDSLKSVGSVANLDYEIITNAEAYALGPVVSYKGETLAMEFIKGENLEDIKNKLEGKKYILYIPFYELTTHKLVNFEFEKLENPKLQYGVRGSILD